MSIEFVQITDHAYKRWNERVRYCSSEYNSETIYEIIQAVKKSKIIKKHEKLPCIMPRVDGSVYSIYEDILFVLEPVNIKSYRLVTVITDFKSTQITASVPSKFNKKKQKQEEFDESQFSSIKKLKLQISKTPKRHKKRKELLKCLFETKELNNDKNQIFDSKKSTEDGLKRYKELISEKK